MQFITQYSEQNMVHLRLPHIMGTRFDALLFGSDGLHNMNTLKSLSMLIMNRMKHLDSSLNMFSKDSEVYGLYTLEPGSPIYVSETLYGILCLCKEYYYKTEGLFDITLGDFDKVEIESDSHRIRFNDKPYLFNFGGFAKGYVLRFIKQMLVEAGIKDAFVNFGNSAILALGKHPYGDSWNVEIKNPYTGDAIKCFSLKDMSLSTSGNTPQYGKHIFNPKTGKYAEGPMLCSVTCPDPLDAEVLSTVLMMANEVEKEKILAEFQEARVESFDCLSKSVGENKI